MSRSVREHYPVADLPEDLRSTGDNSVDATIQPVPQNPERVPTLKDLLAVRRPPYRSTEEIAEELRGERDAWDD